MHTNTRQQDVTTPFRLTRQQARIAGALAIAVFVQACSGGSSTDSSDDTIADDTDPATLNDAYLWFGANVTVALDGNEVVIEATGRPDHTSPYWNPDNSSGLYVEPDPNITLVAAMSPGFIEEYDNLFTLRVDANPTLANTSSATSLGAVGIAVSGAPIFNDQEGPNSELGIGVIRGFDRSGAHTGPSTYHYHLEPKAISDDDDSLIGVIADGFFLFGRQCYSAPDQQLIWRRTGHASADGQSA